MNSKINLNCSILEYIRVCVCVFSLVRLFETPWAHLEFSRQEYWRGLPFPWSYLLPPLFYCWSPPECSVFFFFSLIYCIIHSVQFSLSVVSDSLRPHELLHTRPTCPSPTPRVHSNPCSLCCWCHSIISSSVIPFSSCPQNFPASGSFQMSQLSTSCV